MHTALWLTCVDDDTTHARPCRVQGEQKEWQGEQAEGLGEGVQNTGNK